VTRNWEPCSLNLYTPGRVLCMACVKWSPSSPDPPLYSLPEHVGRMIWHVSNCWISSVGQNAPVGGIAVQRCSLHRADHYKTANQRFCCGIQTIIVDFIRARHWTLVWVGLTLWNLINVKVLFLFNAPLHSEEHCFDGSFPGLAYHFDQSTFKRIEWVWSIGGMSLTVKNEISWRKTCPGVTLSCTYLADWLRIIAGPSGEMFVSEWFFFNNNIIVIIIVSFFVCVRTYIIILNLGYPLVISIVSAIGLSLVQKSGVGCVTVCDLQTSTVRRPGPM
jgi:hypothetical protein